MNENTDRRALLAIVLSLGVYFLWSAFFAPPPPVGPPEGDPVAEGAVVPAPAPGPAVAAAAPTSTETVVPAHEEAVFNDCFDAAVFSEGGGLGHVSLKGYRSHRLVTPWWTWATDRVTGKAEDGWAPYTGGQDPYRLLSTGALGLAGAGSFSAGDGFQVRREGAGWVSRRTRADGLGITTTFSPGDAPCTVKVAVRFDNGSGSPINDLWVGAADSMSGDAGRFLNAIRPLAHVDGSVEHVDDLSDVEGADREVLEGPVSWLGMGDRYFMAVLIPDEPSPTSQVVVDQLADGRTGAFLVDSLPLDAGASRTLSMLAYIGPKDLDALKPLGHDLDEAVEFGWFGLFSRLLLFLLEMFQSAVVNWGVSIILLTFLVKLVFFPLTQKAFASSGKMQALQPKLAEMREKYKDNKELQTQETMKLFSENGVNPLGGCLPTLIQLPVWFALYNTMLYSVELYDTSFLYIQDLTEADPYGIIPTLYAGLMFAQQRMMPMGSMDEAQQKILKMMPLIFAFFMYSFPSGLVLYFCINMSLTILQQWWIKRNLETVPAPA